MLTAAQIQAGAGTQIANPPTLGQTKVSTPGVVISNSIINASSPYCVQTTGSGSVTLTNCTIIGSTSKAVYGANITLINCRIHQVKSDAIQFTKNCKMTGCWISELGYLNDEAPHADGVQLRGANGIVIDNNLFDGTNSVPGTASNSGVFAQTSGTTHCTNVAVTNNFFVGYGFAIHFEANDASNSITGNRLLAGTAQFGFITSAGALIVQSDNLIVTDFDGGAIVIAVPGGTTTPPPVTTDPPPVTTPPVVKTYTIDQVIAYLKTMP